VLHIFSFVFYCTPFSRDFSPLLTHPHLPPPPPSNLFPWLPPKTAVTCAQPSNYPSSLLKVRKVYRYVLQRRISCFPLPLPPNLLPGNSSEPHPATNLGENIPLKEILLLNNPVPDVCVVCCLSDSLIDPIKISTCPSLPILLGLKMSPLNTYKEEPSPGT